MALIKWNDDYSTGIQEMDEQHKKWMEIINRFYDNLSRKDLKTNMSQLLNEAIDYTAFHFREEEALMKKMGYPGIQEQEEEHERIRSVLDEYKIRLQRGTLNVSQPLTNELKSWFSSHITDLDKEYGSYQK